ncbi:CMRF35-like molecule 5 isoform X3 [Pangasianodon hypophthalmus]|uniref:CMRF35-like molecule 5 isoform X3 n=1 Tax=Pangasianodon hypophthalmus TaxID=310915 RepID=UPI0023074FB6|nr:CMRF35-like molecule 5 isoform X3 [Pangasianodon hypophthalmus]
MTILLIFTFCLIIADTDAVTTVTGYRGRSVQIKCPYESGYEEYIKYLCRGECSIWYGTTDIPVESGSAAKDTRFSLYDDTTAKVFTVNITDLRPEDTGTYWCAIERTGLDIYTQILLLVKTEEPSISTVSQSTHTTHSASTHIVSPSVHAETTHSTTNPLNSDLQTIAPSPHVIPGIAIYIMISTGAVLLTVGVFIAIYCNINRQGSETVTQSSRETNGDHENDQNLLPLQAKEKATLPESVYQSLTFTNNQSDSVYQSLTFTNNQSDSVYQSLTCTNNQSDSVYQSLTCTNNQ